MAKKVVGKIKLQIQAGKANPSPPVGPALGQHGVNIMEFCKQFNAKTEAQAGYIIPVVIAAIVLSVFISIAITKSIVKPVEELGNSGICSLCAIVGAVVLLGTAAFFIFKGVLKCVKDNNC